jgi:methionine synthase / methylenetetrahydrofolate reductase(NADPH)
MPGPGGPVRRPAEAPLARPAGTGLTGARLRAASPAEDEPAGAGPAEAGPGAGTLADQIGTGRFVVAAGIAPPAGGVLDDVLETVSGLRERGISLFAVAPRENPRTHLDSLNMALHLQHQARVETIATVTTWDKTIMTLQADLLGAHALGLRSIVCATGSPPVAGDYPAVDGVWEVDSLGLTALLAGLNGGRDSNGLPLTAKTSFCIGARINPGARDPEAELARARAKVEAGAQFLVSRPVYELGPLRDMVGALEPGGVPVLLSVTPLRSLEEAEYLANEVPDVSIPHGALRAMERAGRGSARAAGVQLAAELLGEARSVVGGVVLTALDEDVTALLPLLAAAG